MSNNDFIQQLQAANRPTVVDFWAPWCVPCRRTKPVLDKLAEEFAGQVDFRAINADEQPDLLRELNIMGIPTLVIVDRTGQISRLVGAQSPGYYRSMFESLATGESMVSAAISTQQRILRLGTGVAIAILAWVNAIWWLVPLGLLVMFTAVYDRCPIWQAITARFKKAE